MGLTTQDSQGLTLKAGIKKYVELRKPTTHMRGFFTRQTYDTTAIPLEIQRDNDYAAVDVLRGTGGNMNKFDIWTAKTIVPPFYHEKFPMNSLRSYERIFGESATMTTTKARAALANEVAINIGKINSKIIRAEEIQCVQALETGVVVLKNGDNIDYKRRSNSLVDADAAGEGGYWTNTAAAVEKQLQKAASFIREEGASAAGVFDITMPSQAWIALQATDYFKTKANYKQVKLLSINSPVQSSVGSTYHGQISAGSFIFNIWTYDATYLNDSGVRTRLSDETKIIVTPTEGTMFEMAYGAVDTIVKSSGAQSVSGLSLAKGAADYYVWDNIDTDNLVHTMHMTSAPCARLITVDMVYTLKVASTWVGDNPVQE